jgi:hypothetical protein
MLPQAQPGQAEIEKEVRLATRTIDSLTAEPGIRG